MARFWVFNRRKGSQYVFIAAIAFCAACLILLERPFLAVFSGEDSVPTSAFSSAETDDQEIALTFNVSWGEEHVEPILDTLLEKEVTAAFFVSGVWAERHAELLERMVDEGHDVGNYGYHFKPYTDQENEDMRRDMREGHHAIEEAIDTAPDYFRPPAGIFNSEVLEAAEQMNYTVIHWGADGKDWQNPGVDQIIENVTNSVEPGDVVMLDASDSAKQTAEALPEIIDALQNQNYELTSIDMLMSGATTDYEEL
ncbi:polysaccharide deacetylase family sporulation protein PdaB [Geomicrobium halophilum]|uniref:Polysaccharide deacetylase family sporulation protein PdaB n=1 Tax=Geomicrobium halophilum TaxID=549000 RepID=A0A841Q111_9BACL|nr:polysaccharide deacetylase family protein [Geomicrobium halophilum]MBB6451502.1 polysaccharide deacetylase family sporulation protein PdaB [Geomicrobium halophilum]